MISKLPSNNREGTMPFATDRGDRIVVSCFQKERSLYSEQWIKWKNNAKEKVNRFHDSEISIKQTS